MIYLVLIFFACLVLSAFFSGAEMAFVSSNKVKLRERADQGDPSAKRAVQLHEKPQIFLTANLIGNNIANVTAAAILTYILDRQFRIGSEWIVTAIVVPLFLIFAELIPKDLCRMHAQQFILRFSFLLRQFSLLFYFPTLLLMQVVKIILGPLGIIKNRSIFVSEQEFRSLIDESTKDGVVTQEEKRMIDTILDFEKIRVDAVMIPAAKAPKVSITDSVSQVKDIARKTHTKMVLVYEEIPSLIVGMVYVFDILFEENEKAGLKNYLRSPVFLPKSTSIEKAFLTLQEKRQSYAVVTDDRGEVIGVVPIERLLVV